MNISEWAFNYRKPVFMLLAIFLAYGFMSYFTLPAREDPQITIREAIVTTLYTGMDAEKIEQLITKKIERKIREISEVEEIRSNSISGQSIIHVEIQDQFDNLDPIWQNLRNKVSEVQSSLPDGAQTSVVNDEFGDVSVITLALTGSGFEMSELYDMAKHIRDSLYRVPATKKIDILGVQAERIYAEISNAKLAQLGISPNDLEGILSSQNIIRPGGVVDIGSKSITVEPTGNFENLEDIGDTFISIPGTEFTLPLSDIVTISRGYVDPPDKTSYFNGKPAIFFAISMLEGNNVLEFSPRMKAAIADVESTLPVGMSLEIATYQADQVAATVNGVSISVFQTLVIVLAVVMLFLGMRTGLIVGAIVPCVMLVTLAIMNISGMELERMSLATLIIALGLLVDNGIVIAEDYKRRLEHGDSRFAALKEGGTELAVPLLVSSLTTILVFLPLMLANHVAGEYTRSISLVILISLLVSWVLALCITPVLCYYFLRVSDDTEKSKGFIEKLNPIYERFLHWALSHRKIFLSAMMGIFIGALLLMNFVPKQFFPDSDRAQLLIYVELPAGTSSRTTDRRVRDVFSLLDDKAQFSSIESYSGYVGYGGPRFVLSLSPEDPAANKAFIVLNIKNNQAMDPTLNALRVALLQNFPDMRTRVSRMFLGPTDASKLEVQVKGPDADVLYATAQKIESIFRSVPSTIDIRQSWENKTVRVQVKIDQQRARRAGVTSNDVALSMQTYFDGSQITEYREEDDIIPIVFRGESNERNNIDRMRTMNVYSSERDVNVPLFQIADFFPKNQYARIDHENMFRTITIEGKNLDLTAEDMKVLVNPRLEELKAGLPKNHWIEYDGVISDSADAQRELSANIPIVIGVILVLLVLQFNSFRRPGIIILTIPLSLIGAVLGLLLTSSYFGFMVTLGLYSLAGIIINNGIVLIERIDIEQEEGKGVYQAIVSACLMRLRPIVMTTITTVLGLLPLILSRDPLFYGMSNAIAFGLGVGTILTLGVVPVLYAVLFKVPSPSQ